MGNNFGKVSPSTEDLKTEGSAMSSYNPLKPIEDEPVEYEDRGHLTKEDYEYAKKNFAGLITKNNPERLKQQEELKKLVVSDFLGTTKELEATFKKINSRRTVLENVDIVKSSTLPTIPLVGDVVNKIFDLGLLVGKKYLERSNVQSTCSYAFTTISEIFGPLAVIDKFYEELKNRSENSDFSRELKYFHFETKLEKYYEFKTTVEEIIAETSVMMLDQSIIEKIFTTFTQGEYKNYFCSQPDKYKLEDPTFFETIIYTAIEIKQKNKNRGKIFTIPQFLVEELNRKISSLSINFIVIIATYQDLKDNFPNIKHDLTRDETRVIESFIDNAEILATPDEIPPEMPEKPNTQSIAEGGTRRKKQSKTKRMNVKKRRKTLNISKDLNLKKSKRRF